MRLAIVGAGLIGQKRAAAVDDEDTVLGFFDVSPASAQSASAEFGGRAFTSIQELENAVVPGDVVCVATPHSALAPTARFFLEAGCHVLIEKPGSITAHELIELRKLCSHQQAISVGYNHRFHPGVVRLKDIARTELFGRLLSIRARYGHGGRPGYENEWRAQKLVAGGGELLDQGSHLIDLVFYIGGRFELLHSHIATLKWDMEVEDNAWLIGSTGDNAVAALHASWTEWKNLFSFEVFFETAKVEVFGLGGSYGPETVVESKMEAGFGPPTITTTQFPPQDDSWKHEWQDFKRSIDSGLKGEAAGVDDALAVLTVIEKVYKSAYI